MTARYLYNGDINLQYGGLFWWEDGADDYVCAVEVTPCSDAGGPDNLFWVNKGSIYLGGDDKTRASALETIGAAADPSRREVVEAFHAYHGLERDEEYVVRIGKPEEARLPHEWSDMRVDKVLRAGASLRNWVKRELLP